jgi:hypothetical protein
MERGFSIHQGKGEGRSQTEKKTLVAANRVKRSDNCAARDGRYKVVHPGNDRATIEESIATIAVSIASSRFVFADGVCPGRGIAIAIAVRFSITLAIDIHFSIAFAESVSCFISIAILLAIAIAISISFAIANIDSAGSVLQD